MRERLVQMLREFHAIALGLRLWSKSIQLHDLKALTLLPDLKMGYVPWTTSSLRPGAVRAIVNEVIVNNRKKVLECGSGISSLFIAHELSNRDGKLISIENDEDWIHVISDLSSRAGISEDTIKFVHAPLREVTLESSTYLWYDREIVEQHLRGELFDVLVVDGPLAEGSASKNARIPALRILEPYMRDEACIFIDDIHRRAERRLARRWSRTCHKRLSLRPIESGMAILRSDEEPPRNIW